MRRNDNKSVQCKIELRVRVGAYMKAYKATHTLPLERVDVNEEVNKILGRMTDNADEAIASFYHAAVATYRANSVITN
ncbi:MAG: hypothetical protein J6M06_03000 [Synergistaceae bacterium]|nr:hypothetical protein [Synergistaceae bacterium]